MYINGAMRLDAYLVARGYVSSRSRAKKAIKEGWVQVNDQIIRKPSYSVSYTDEVEIQGGADRPAGYWKLKSIQEETNIIRSGDRVLDVGSSAGGFIMYAMETAEKVYGVEYSREFRSRLRRLAHEHPNVAVAIGDVFTLPLQEISPTRVDVILNDLTLEVEDSIAALERLLPLLEPGGRVLQVVKDPTSNTLEWAEKRLGEMGLRVTRVLSSEKNEAYIIAAG